MDNFLNRLYRNPYAPIDAASITRVDDAGNGYDDWNNMIAPATAPHKQTWGEIGQNALMSPVRIGASLLDSINPYQANEHPITEPDASNWRVPPLATETWNAISAPGRAYYEGMSPEEMQHTAATAAGLMMGGGGITSGLESAAARGGVSLGDRVMAKYLDWKHPNTWQTPTPDVSSSKLAWRYGADLNTNDILQRYSPMEVRAGNMFGEPDLSKLNRYQTELLNKLTSDDARYADLNRRSNDIGVGGDVNAYKTKPIRPDLSVIDGGLAANASKEAGIPAIVSGYRGKPSYDVLFPDHATEIWASSSPQVASTYTRLGPNGESWLDGLSPQERAFFDHGDFGGQVTAPLQMNFQNPMNVDASGSIWSGIPFEGDLMDADALASVARGRGHDGLIINNVVDEGPGFEGQLGPSNSYAALKRGTITSPLTGETLFSNASKEASLPALANVKLEYDLDSPFGKTAYAMKDGMMVGEFSFDELPNALMMRDARVDPDFRRQGIASEVYGKLQDEFGLPMTPDVTLTPDGYSFWKKNYPEAVKNYTFNGISWRPDGAHADPNLGYDAMANGVPDWRMSGGPNRPPGVVWSNADTKSSLPMLANALSDEGKGIMDILRERGFLY